MALFCMLTFCMLMCGVVMEPMCSRYEYEDKLLHKLIKMEFEWRELQNTVKSSLENMKLELSNARQEVNGAIVEVKNILKDTEAERAKISSSVEAQKNDMMDIIRIQEGDVTELRNNFIDFMQQINRNISDIGTTTTVAFNARDVKHLNPAKGDTVIFTTNLLNEGDAYNNQTGVFTAPVSGLYLFTVQLCSKNQLYFVASLIIGGKEYSRLFSYDTDDNVCHSCQGTAVMQPGDTALVQNIYSAGERLFRDGYRGMFYTGTLINKL